MWRQTVSPHTHTHPPAFDFYDTLPLFLMTCSHAALHLAVWSITSLTRQSASCRAFHYDHLLVHWNLNSTAWPHVTLFLGLFLATA